eukprot:378878_1
MQDSWKQEITYDWDELDHAAAFESWKQEFNKEYTDLETEAEAFITFLDNWRMINDFNIAEEETFTLRMNQFSDMTGDQFRFYIHGHDGSCMMKRTVEQRTAMRPITPEVDAPDSIDWTNNGGKSYVTPVKNQGQCGSCWAFSTTGSLESRAAIQQGSASKLVSLSEQQLVDCSRAEGNAGCNGGLQEDAFTYIGKAGGLCSESEYPYTGRDGNCKASTCGTKYDKIAATNSYTQVKKDDEESLVNALAQGPVAVSVDAGGTGWQHYKSGVYSSTCGVLLDHGVTGVGYGTASPGGDYWLIKNSWGKTWGEQGYILICRNCNKNGRDGECGILMEPNIPTF